MTRYPLTWMGMLLGPPVWCHTTWPADPPPQLPWGQAKAVLRLGYRTGAQDVPPSSVRQLCEQVGRAISGT